MITYSLMLARLICLLGFLFWCGVLTFKYCSFGFYDWDFALYSQAMWSLCHGTTTASLFGTSFLADHAHFIAFLITPLYFIFRHPLTLIYLEVFSLYMGAYILYQLAQRLTTPMTALGLLIIYIFHPANIFMLLFEFHFESLCLGLIFLLFYLQYLGRYTAFIVTALVLMLVKENMALIVLMMGAYGLIFKPGGRIKWGLLPMCLGLVFFMLNMFVIMPLVRQHLTLHQSAYWGLFSWLGHTPGEILKNLFLHPLSIARQLATLENFNFVKGTLGGFIFGTLCSPFVLLIATPIFLQNLLSGSPMQHTLFFHYAATLVPFCAVSAVYGFAFLKKICLSWFYHALLILSLLWTAQGFMDNLPSMQRSLSFCDSKKATIREFLIRKIPPDAGVVASIIFLSHLSQRKDVYALYNVWMNTNYFTGEHPFHLPPTVHYALVDFYEPYLMFNADHQKYQSRINKFLKTGDWRLKYNQSGMALYER